MRKDLHQLDWRKKYTRGQSLQFSLRDLELKSIEEVKRMSTANLDNVSGAIADCPTKRHISFFRCRTKSPCKVVLKAPFHYKKGKHRLSLFQRKLTVRTVMYPDLSGGSLTIVDILDYIPILTKALAPVGSPAMPMKESIVSYPMPVSASVLTLR